MLNDQTFFFHIGLQKTASTLIQGAFRADLGSQVRARGIGYVDRLAVRDLPSARGSVAKVHPKPKLRDAFERELSNLFKQQLKIVSRATGRPATGVLMSNESATGPRGPDPSDPYRPAAEAAIKQVLDVVEPARTTVLMYVRRQDRLIESEYMQRVHDGLTITFEQFLRKVSQRPLVYFDELADRIAAIDGVDELRIRPFEIISGGGAAYVRDFCSPLGLEDLDYAFVHDIGTPNESFTEPAMRAALRVNQYLDNDDEVRKVRTFLRYLFPKSEYPAPTLFTDEERQDVIDAYGASNRRLFETWMPDFDPNSYVDPEALQRLKQTLRPPIEAP